MPGELRLRAAVFLCVGKDADNFTQQIAEGFGGDVARAVSNRMFVCNNACVPTDARVLPAWEFVNISMLLGGGGKQLAAARPVSDLVKQRFGTATA